MPRGNPDQAESEIKEAVALLGYDRPNEVYARRMINGHAPAWLVIEIAGHIKRSRDFAREEMQKSEVEPLKRRVETLERTLAQIRAILDGCPISVDPPGILLITSAPL
jgi:hypothetical protein